MPLSLTSHMPDIVPSQKTNVHSWLPQSWVSVRGRTPIPQGTTPSPTWRRETGYLHATVRHGHGIIGQGVAGDLAVVGAGGWCEDIAGTYVIRINGVVSLEGPTGESTKAWSLLPTRNPGRIR